ncbi:MAG: hypothetical protein Q4E02_01130 [Lagierella massiliensis]|nr:hypothetical protein [Lagierella massiliensis]
MKKFLNIVLLITLSLLLVNCTKYKKEYSEEEIKNFSHDFVLNYILGDGDYDYKEVYDKYLVPENEMFNKEMYIRQKSAEVYTKMNMRNNTSESVILDERVTKANDEYIYDASVKVYKDSDDSFKIRLVLKTGKENIKVINYYGHDLLSGF